MIILDMNQVMIANLFAHLGNQNGEPLNEDMLRHMVLNAIRSFRVKFKQEYGEIVIACDHSSWRKKAFAYYKANRDKSQATAFGVSWDTIFETLNKIRNELKEHFPYKVIHVEGAEADDIIAELVRQHGVEFGSGDEKILILSGDKDFKQLHHYSNVDQYDPVQKKFVKEKDPQGFLVEHIICGDRSDGIPNIYSQDDTFVTGKRQKSITEKRLGECKSIIMKGQALEGELLRNYERNRQLIDLDKTPEHIRAQIMEQFKTQEGKSRANLLNYFIQHRLRHLTSAIGEF